MALLCALLIVNLLLVVRCIDESTVVTHNITWSANVSILYPPSSPLEVRLGDMLDIKCPPDATSNVWIQTDLRQYEMCDCNAEGVENPDCQASTTVRQVCQDEVLLKITTTSNELASALSFEPGTYYLISYSPGNKSLDGYLTVSVGGECLEGYRMVMSIQSLAVRPIITPPPIVTTTATDKMDPFTKATTAKDTITTTLKPGPNASGLNSTAVELASGAVTYSAAILVSLSFMCL